MRSALARASLIVTGLCMVFALPAVARRPPPPPPAVASPTPTPSPQPTDTPSPTPSPEPTASPKPKARARPNPAASVVKLQVGSWRCSIAVQGSRAVQNVVVVWAPYGAGWIKGTADVPAFKHRPAYAADFTLGYDARKKQWVNVYMDDIGGYEMSRSDDPPTATSLRFYDAFPIAPTDGVSIVTLSDRRSGVESRWTVRGKQIVSHELCDKQSI